MKHVPPPSGELVEAFDNLTMAVSPAWHQAIIRLANAAERVCEKLGWVCSLYWFISRKPIKQTRS